MHLAQLRMAERMAEKVGDKEFAEQCRKWLQAGSESMESKMWAGEYYLSYYEPSTGKRSDRVFSVQLDGEWMALIDGLPGVFRQDRVKTALATIKRVNVPLSPYGLVFLANADGSPWNGAGYGPYTYFVAELLMVAMTYMYEGEREFGLELSRRCLHNLMVKGYTWNQPCIIRADTGDRLSGYDYYQNLMLWSLPAAVENKDLGGPCAPGGLVDRIIQSGKKA